MNNLLKKSINKYQKTQDVIHEIQKNSNEIRSLSKQVIALLRRDNIQESTKLIKRIEGLFRLSNKTIKNNKELINQSFYKEAVEEHIEAITLYNFLTKSNKKAPEFIEVGEEEIIAGICDFTGELLRRAITIASVENFKQIKEYKKIIENIAEQLTKICFKGKLRQKYDEVERNLSKIEDIIYDIKLKQS
jgi:predicted translin family RNA/ssDNA-binding protein